MKKAFYKIASILMTFVVLLSTMSFTISMHYCQGELVDTAIFQKAHSCGMEQNIQMSSVEKDIMMKGCCNDTQITIEGQDDLKLPVVDLTVDQQVFITTFVHTYSNLFITYEENDTLYFDYSPPIKVRQIFKLDETYLI
ncbi:MAG: hypothetical protein JKY02_05130 [Flavobacteriaceae bacterium]|nr:hypothetical protein [Flavobacteriaceae bacterium]